MRISAGTAKGRKVGAKKVFTRAGEGDELRPTSSKVREALFDILRNVLPDASFLDLYAGTGAVGIEALSRGAGKVVFVESNDLRVKMINRLVSDFHFEDRSKVLKTEAYDFVKKAVAIGERYDIIFLDPPYASEELAKVLPLVGEGDILEEGGTVVVEHFSKRPLPDVINGLRIVKNYKYGDSALSLYRLEKS